jgi:hypothetical protein
VTGKPREGLSAIVVGSTVIAVGMLIWLLASGALEKRSEGKVEGSFVRAWTEGKLRKYSHTRCYVEIDELGAGKKRLQVEPALCSRLQGLAVGSKVYANVRNYANTKRYPWVLDLSSSTGPILNRGEVLSFERRRDFMSACCSGIMFVAGGFCFCSGAIRFFRRGAKNKGRVSG